MKKAAAPGGGNCVVSPNLPQRPVSLALLGQDAAELNGGEILRNLEKLSVQCILVPRCGDLPRPVASHPDMLCHHLGGDRVAVYKGIADKIAPELERYGFAAVESSRALGPRYPDDVALNAAVLGKTAFFHAASIDRALLDFYRQEGIKTVDVRQGYAKCSIFAVDAGSLMTSDPSIGKKAAENGFDVLFIREGWIRLPGYGHGFIGGCGGLLSQTAAVFAGEIETHPDAGKIRGFLAARGIRCLSLCAGELSDIGGILPLREKE